MTPGIPCGAAAADTVDEQIADISVSRTGGRPQRAERSHPAAGVAPILVRQRLIVDTAHPSPVGRRPSPIEVVVRRGGPLHRV